MQLQCDDDFSFAENKSDTHWYITSNTAWDSFSCDATYVLLSLTVLVPDVAQSDNFRIIMR